MAPLSSPPTTPPIRSRRKRRAAGGRKGWREDEEKRRIWWRVAFAKGGRLPPRGVPSPPEKQEQPRGSGGRACSRAAAAARFCESCFFFFRQVQLWILARPQGETKEARWRGGLVSRRVLPPLRIGRESSRWGRSTPRGARGFWALVTRLVRENVRSLAGRLGAVRRVRLLVSPSRTLHSLLGLAVQISPRFGCRFSFFN